MSYDLKTSPLNERLQAIEVLGKRPLEISSQLGIEQLSKALRREIYIHHLSCSVLKQVNRPNAVVERERLKVGRGGVVRGIEVVDLKP